MEETLQIKLKTAKDVPIPNILEKCYIILIIVP